MTKNILKNDVFNETETANPPSAGVKVTDGNGVTSVDPSSAVWADKYRPGSLDELMLPERVQRLSMDWIAGESIPHILVAGPSGIGKTSFLDALIKAKRLSPLKYNGNLKRGIDLVREIKSATSTLTVFGEHRAIFIDEMDGLTPEAFSGLRGDTITGASATSVFMAACNKLPKIPLEIQNHFFIIDLGKEILADRSRLMDLHANRAVWILQQEGVSFEPADIERIVRENFPSVRAWMKELQGFSAGGKLQPPGTPTSKLADTAPSLVPDSEGGPSELESVETAHPTKTSALLDDIEAFIARFVALKPESVRAMALFVLHTYAHDVAANSPLLWLSSQEKRCGKTTALKTMSRLVPRPIITSNISVPGMLRAIQDERPTFLIDETAHALKASKDLQGILLLGHAPDGVRVLATGVYSTWAPKVLALIGELPDPLDDRSIRIALRRRLPSEKVERFAPIHDNIAAELRKRCESWASATTLKSLRDADPALPTSLDDRAQDNWRPLLAIADLADGGWETKTRQAAEAISGLATISEPSPGLLILEAARGWFSQQSDGHISSAVLADLAQQVGAVKGPARSRMIKIARILVGFEVSRATFRVGATTEKGYRRTDFENAFDRYLVGDAID